MTDEAYCLRRTEMERKTLARQSRYKKNGSRTSYVRLPQYTQKEWKKMNSPCVKMDKPMSRGEFKKLPELLKREYIIHLCKNYDARRLDIGKMLGYSDNGFWSLSKQLFGINEPYENHKKHPSEKWLNFINPPANDEIETVNDEIEEAPKVTAEPLKVPDASLGSMKLRFVGDPAIAFAKAIRLLENNTNYDISIEVYPTLEGPRVLPF